MGELSDRLIAELVDAVRAQLRKEQGERQRDVYLIGDIEKDTARLCIERLRELANDNNRPITLYINSAGGNVTDGLAIHDVVRHIISRGIEVTVIVQGMAYSMGSVVLQAASDGRRLTYPALVDHDSRAGEVGRLAVDDRRRAAPRAAEADAGSDLQDPVVPLRQAAPPDHPGHQAHRLLPRRAERARLRPRGRDCRRRAAGAEAGGRGCAGCRRRCDAPQTPAEACAEPRGERASSAEPAEATGTILPSRFRDARHSSSSRAALPATEWSVGVQPSARARGLRTT